jgi:hypothetical protein
LSYSRKLGILPYKIYQGRIGVKGLVKKVEIFGSASKKIVYLKKLFHERPNFAAMSVNYGIAELADGAEIILKRSDYVHVEL